MRDAMGCCTGFRTRRQPNVWQSKAAKSLGNEAELAKHYIVPNDTYLLGTYDQIK